MCMNTQHLNSTLHNIIARTLKLDISFTFFWNFLENLGKSLGHTAYWMEDPWGLKGYYMPTSVYGPVGLVHVSFQYRSWDYLIYYIDDKSDT